MMPVAAVPLAEASSMPRHSPTSRTVERDTAAGNRRRAQEQVVDPFFALKIGSCSCICVLEDGSAGANGLHEDGYGGEPWEVMIEPGRPGNNVREAAKRSPPPGPRPDDTDVSTKASTSPPCSTEQDWDNTLPIVRDNEDESLFIRPPIALFEAQVGQQDAAASAAANAGTEAQEAVRSFERAAHSGRFLQAARELRRIETLVPKPEALLGEAAVEQVRRITAQYERSMSALERQDEDPLIREENEELRIKWSMELSGPDSSLMRLVVVTEEEDLDIVAAYAAALERDLQFHFNKGLTGAEQLGISDYDNMWRSFTYSKTTGTKHDNVVLNSAIDALDEPVGALWQASYTPPPGVTDKLFGVPIPPVKEGHQRSESMFWFSTLKPSRDADGRYSAGFRLTTMMETRLPKVVARALRWLPSQILKSIARHRVEEVPQLYRTMVRTCAELHERIRQSPRAAFYAQVRRHLAGDSSPLRGTLEAHITSCQGLASYVAEEEAS